MIFEILKILFSSKFPFFFVVVDFLYLYSYYLLINYKLIYQDVWYYLLEFGVYVATVHTVPTGATPRVPRKRDSLQQIHAVSKRHFR